MNDTKTSQTPHHRRFASHKIKLRLSSAESVHRVYDNKTYKTQLNKLFEFMNKSPSKRTCPHKCKEMSSSFISSVLNNLSDFSGKNAENMITECPKELESTSMVATTKRHVQSLHHRRIVSMTNHQDGSSMKDDDSKITEKVKSTINGFLNTDLVELTRKPLELKSRRFSPSIRSQPIDASTKTVKSSSEKRKKHFMSVIGRKNMGEDSDKIEDERNKAEDQNHLKFPKINIKKIDPKTLDFEYLPNKEDILIINHEIQCSQTSLILNSSESFDVKDKSESIRRQSPNKNKNTSPKGKKNLNDPSIVNNKIRQVRKDFIFSLDRTPYNVKSLRTASSGARRIKEENGSPFSKSRRETSGALENSHNEAKKDENRNAEKDIIGTKNLSEVKGKIEAQRLDSKEGATSKEKFSERFVFSKNNDPENKIKYKKKKNPNPLDHFNLIQKTYISSESRKVSQETSINIKKQNKYMEMGHRRGRSMVTPVVVTSKE